jgi:sucrose-6-phosphate hydrolase SacC (GH32 family)
MSLPRELSLKKEGDEWLLQQQPVAGIDKLKGATLVDESVLVSNNKWYDTKSTQLEMQVEGQPAANGTCGVQLAAGNGHYAEIGYDAARQTLYMDRSHCANQAFNKNFAKLSRYETPLALKNGVFKLHIFFDNSIIEVFANDGDAVMTMQVFPDEADNGAALFSNGGTATFSAVKIWKMNSAWE